jgi:hypothetical protein
MQSQPVHSFEGVRLSCLTVLSARVEPVAVQGSFTRAPSIFERGLLMETCSRHDIAYSGGRCPVCSAESKIEDLEYQVRELESQVRSLENIERLRNEAERN